MKKKILLLENDSDIRDIVSYVLEEDGFKVLTANPWPANLLVNYQADLILLDEWINKNEGHLLCKEIKLVHELRHIPVVLFSTASNIEEIVKTCHADGFVKKPFELNDLLNEINKCITLTNAE